VFKYTYSVEIVPICKDDLVCIPLKQARLLSNISPLTICIRVGNSIQLLDPATLQSCDIPSPIYWRTPFDSLATVSELVEFTVLDIDPDSTRTKGKFLMADAQVALAGAFHSRGGANTEDDNMMDFESPGFTNQIYHTRTHLGSILQPGDTALGYFLTNANYNSDHFASLPPGRIPDVILVKKTYPNRRKKSKARNWKLRSIAKEAGEDGETSSARGAIGRMGGRDQKKVEEDYEHFLRDLEEDPELRSGINLYKATDVLMAPPDVEKKSSRRKVQYAMEVDEPSPVVEHVPSSTVPGANEEEEEEPDFPEVNLDELLEGFDELTLGAAEGEETDPVQNEEAKRKQIEVLRGQPA
jgi:nonsense-mediated mRNA decay protein 3